MNKLPLLNVFEKPYELWEVRNQTPEEMMQSGCMFKRIKVKLKARLHDHVDAAKHMILEGTDNQLERFIKDYLKKSASFKEIRSQMPSKTPKSLSDYQRRFQRATFEQVSIDINNCGKILSDDQYLFHGGLLPINIGESFITERPFSTSFCPQIALRNAEWGGKAYDAGEVNLCVLRTVSSQTKTFIFRLNGTDKGHEVEVLFAAGAKITLRNKVEIRNCNVYKACRLHPGRLLKKEIPFYLVEVDIS
ncbi:hypothetical protein KO537_19300 [Shewanella sp. NKUCC01_JLK]|uniref:hypothetical protein n=1 Tax=Shewanella sp. NKUCC01_JLK TaxID=2842123 RepID=UPI001C5A95D4|nr:hypothetical protein [Shewanella sp. NKUCC01_JLK]MBW3516836.1 hypothetical protein [Shewanella sp. NKUCC01_JLK]